MHGPTPNQNLTLPQQFRSGPKTDLPKRANFQGSYYRFWITPNAAKTRGEAITLLYLTTSLTLSAQFVALLQSLNPEAFSHPGYISQTQRLACNRSLEGLKLNLRGIFAGNSRHWRNTDQISPSMSSFFSLIPDILPMILPSTVQIIKASELETQRSGNASPMIRQGAVIGKSDRMCATGRFIYFIYCAPKYNRRI